MTAVGRALLAAIILALTLSAPAFLSDHQIHILIQNFIFRVRQLVLEYSGWLCRTALIRARAIFGRRRIYFNLAAASPWSNSMVGHACRWNASGGTWPIHRLSEL